MKNIMLFVYLIILSCALFASVEPALIFSQKVKTDVNYLNKNNISIDRVFYQSIRVYVSEKQFYDLKENGFKIEYIPNEAKIYADLLEKETKNSTDPLFAYFSYTEYEAFLQQMVTQYPDICHLETAGVSVQGRNLWFLKISDNANIEEAEPEVRLTSSIHGDEVVGYDLLVRLIQLLTSQYGIDTRITSLVNNTEIWINPMTNPDGYVAHNRTNANGVDLNRNFPDFSNNEPDNPIGEEPEIANIMNFSKNHSSVISINFHGGSQVVNYPWDCITTLHPENDLLENMAITYASNNPILNSSTEFPGGVTNGAAWYIIHGSLQDYLNYYHDCKDITIEVSNDKWPNVNTLDSYWNNNQESLLQYIEYAQKGIKGIVTNQNNEPIEAMISIPGKTNHFTDPQVGDYHKILLNGTYDLTFSAYGYQSQTVTNVVVPNNQTEPVICNVVMQPVNQVSYCGFVKDQFNSPLSNVTIKLSVNSEIVTEYTDNFGYFSFNTLYPGTYASLVSMEGFVPLSKNVTLNGEGTVFNYVLFPPVFVESFDAGLDNWVVQAPWAITNINGNNVLTDSPVGEYNNNINKIAKLNTILNMNDVSSGNVSFKIKYNLETNYDFLYFEISTNNTQWTTIQAYTGISDWKTVVSSLDSYAGHDVYLRFRISTDEGTTSDGVYIDDIMFDNRSMVEVSNQDLVLNTNKMNCNIYPNPIIGNQEANFSISSTKVLNNTKIMIYNVKGQRVISLPVNSKNGHVSWNMKNDQNQRVSTGIYFYKIKSETEESLFKKMLIIK